MFQISWPSSQFVVVDRNALNGNNVVVQSTQSSTVATGLGTNWILAPRRLRDTNSTLPDLCHGQRTLPGRLDS